MPKYGNASAWSRRLPLRGDILEVGQRLEVGPQMVGVEAGLEPPPAEPLRLLVATGSEQRRDPRPIPVASSHLLEREGPQLLQVPGRELVRRAFLEEGERLFGAAGREQAGRDGGRPLRGPSGPFVLDECVDIALVVGDVLQGTPERAGGCVVTHPSSSGAPPERPSAAP